MSNLRRSEREALRNRQSFENEVKDNQRVNQQIQDYWSEQNRREQEAAEKLRQNRGW